MRYIRRDGGGGGPTQDQDDHLQQDRKKEKSDIWDACKNVQIASTVFSSLTTTKKEPFFRSASACEIMSTKLTIFYPNTKLENCVTHFLYENSLETGGQILLQKDVTMKLFLMSIIG